MGGMPGMMPGMGSNFGPGGPMVPMGALPDPGQLGAANGGGAPPQAPAASAMGDTATSANSGGSQTQGRTQYIQKQQRWLLFLRHCAKCTLSADECTFARSCRVGKELWQHILKCSQQNCSYPRCVSSKDLLKHHQKCQVRGAARRGVGGHMPGGVRRVAARQLQ